MRWKTTMGWRSILVVLAACVPVTAAVADDVTQSKFESAYYKDFPQFHPYPDEKISAQTINHFGPVGISIELFLPPFQMRVKGIEKDSPAEATGKLKAGQIIASINGQVLKDIDPRVILGNLITKAEATDGVVKFLVKEKADAPAEEVIVKIPVLGAYSKTWPLNCPKSARIVRNYADYLAKSGNRAGAGIDQGLLFLLSTGEEKDLEVARGWVKELVEKNKGDKPIESNSWGIGYGAPGVCEYYLRTGDESVIPLIEKYADWARRSMYNGGWNHNPVCNFSYGHMNAAGLHVVKFLLLAKECGARVDEYTLQESFKHFFRFAGHGNTPYGDGLPEGGFVDNGKVGGLAFTLAAAASLTPEGENSVYAKARDISAVKSFYSTSWMLHGHTGGGIGEVWRGSAMGLMYDKKPTKYREFMDGRAWHYDMSRRFNGSLGVLGMSGEDMYYDSEMWGSGLALSYTIPRKTLRMTGAPRSKFSKTCQLPKRPWGTEADEAFYSLAPAPDKNGKMQDVDSEKLVTDASWPILRKVNDPKVTDEVLLMYARHPDQGVRDMAVQVIAKLGRDPLIVELLKDKDPRARYSGVSAGRLTDETAQLLIGMVNDPNEAWWVVQNALSHLGPANPELLAPHVDRLCYWLQHDDWWLRAAALTAVAPVTTDARFYKKVLPIVGRIMVANRSAGGAYPLGSIVAKLQGAKPEVQAFAVNVLGQAYADFPARLTVPGGLDIAQAQDMLLGNLAQSLAGVSGGFDELYKVAAKRFPGQTLPYKELYLGASPEQLGPKVAEVMKPTILNSLIPEHVGKNWKSLSAMASAEMQGTPGGRNDVMDQLADLYRRGGDTTDYGWHAFGPDRHSNEWAYLTFDPPEKKEGDGSGRYRPVTLPEGMTNWFAVDFDAGKAGWKKGLAPFANVDGKLQAGGCNNAVCGCGDPPNTLWDKEVLLIRRTFELPPIRPGYRYRLLMGGSSHVGKGDGVAVYVNGRKIIEENGPRGRNSGGLPKGAFITSEWFNDFKGGKVTVAAIGFLSNRKSTHLNLWFEEMKMPPMGEELLRQWAQDISLLSASWQALQDPSRNSENPEAGKFKWDGKVAANPAVLGAWTTVAVVPAIEAFDPAKPVDANKAPFKEITFKDGGKTGEPLRLWSGDTLMDLETRQALKMTVKADHLFIEAGGFSDKNPVGWKSPLIVMKRAM